jgi:hypothetical protein
MQGVNVSLKRVLTWVMPVCVCEDFFVRAVFSAERACAWPRAARLFALLSVCVDCAACVCAAQGAAEN